MNPMLPASVQSDLVLASGSPRRAEILRMLGFDFEVVVAPVNEDVPDGADPAAHVRELALSKAQAARGRASRGLWIGADTVVVVDGEILNKPASADEALSMLSRLRGRWHDVHTGVALVEAATQQHVEAAERTAVLFRRWDDAFLRRYIATGECRDKAGAYAIQGLGALLVQEIRGCYFNVMGFPVGCFVDLLSVLRPLEVPDAG